MSQLTLLIVGGYGAFGARLVELLEHDPRLTLIVAGRSLGKARAWCAARKVAATLKPAAFDRDGDVATALAQLKPGIVVDCSGPFQAYGEGRYRLIEACIAARVNYLDLADGSEFVAGVAAFDEKAREQSVYVLSGASSFPVLTAAAVRALSADMAHVDRITGGIAPSPHARVGENVIRAIASYAGHPIALRRNGATATSFPFADQKRRVIAAPGREPLESRLFSLVDVPDLRALPELWPEARDVWMGAAPVPEILHRALIALAWLVRLKLVPSLSPLAKLMHWATNRLRWGAHRGGMFVAVEGRATDGEARARSWHLLAEGEDGPLIPSMAVAAIVQRVLRGDRPEPGARAATRALELADYAEQFAARTIYTGFRDDADADAPLYQRILGDAWEQLPAPIRAMHQADSARGQGTVARGSNPLAQLVAAIIGFPRTGEVPVTVRFDARDGKETWPRTFGADTFLSVQSEGAGRDAHMLVERFGPLRFVMALVVDGGKLHLVLKRWSAFGVPLPLWLGPRSQSNESVGADGRFRFYVDISHRLIGRIIKYEGWLEPYSISSTTFSPAPESRAASEADMN